MMEELCKEGGVIRSPQRKALWWEVNRMCAVSYTHLDVYKRQRSFNIRRVTTQWIFRVLLVTKITQVGKETFMSRDGNSCIR